MTDLEMLEKMHGSAAAGLDIMAQVMPVSQEQLNQAMQELDSAYQHLKKRLEENDASL